MTDTFSLIPNITLGVVPDENGHFFHEADGRITTVAAMDRIHDLPFGGFRVDEFGFALLDASTPFSQFCEPPFFLPMHTTPKANS